MKSIILKTILFTFVVWLSSTTLSAQISLVGTTQDSPMEIKVDECYLFPTDYSYACFTFQAETDGLLYLTLSKPLKIFSKEGPLPIFDKQCILGIQAGKVYSFHNSNTWGDSITMTPSFVTGKSYLPIALISTSLTDGATYRTTNQDGDITFTFNININAASVKTELILADGESISINNYRTSEDYNTLGTNYVVQLAETYNSLTKSGKLKKGDSFKVTLSNIISNTHPENKYEGEFTLNLKASGEPTKLIHINQTEKLLSYYMPGDTTGLITLTFSTPITCTSENAILSYGDRESGTWKELKIPYTIYENTITWNVQGIHLSNVPSDNEGNKYVSISLKNICDSEGFPIESNAEGTIGTILFSYLIENMDINIYPDFLPIAGSNIDQVKEIEIWISAGKYITFNGVKITYQKDGQNTEENIPLEKLRQEDDPYSDTDLLVYIPIEDLTFDAGEVIIEFVGVSAANGTNPEIKVSYMSTGKGGNHISSTSTIIPSVLATYLLDGTLTTTHPVKKGIYLQKMSNGKVHKIIIH